MIKKLFLLCLFLILFVFPAHAELENVVLNPSFDTGLSEWTYGSRTSWMSSGYDMVGVARLSGLVGTSTGSAYIQQDVDFTGVSEISYISHYGTATSDYHTGIKIYVDTTEVYSYTGGSFNTNMNSVDISSYGFDGVHTLKFYAFSNYQYSSSTWDIGDVYLMAEPRDYKIIFDGSSYDQNWYINDTYIDSGVTKDGIIDFTISPFDSDKFYFINDSEGEYQFICDDNDSTDDGIYSRMNRRVFLPYVNGTKCYTFTLYEVDGLSDTASIPWYLILYDPVSWIINYYSSDEVVYNELDSISITLHSVNSTVYEIPEAPEELNNSIQEPTLDNPFSNLSDDADYVLPDLQDGDNNNTMNTTVFIGYYNDSYDSMNDIYKTGSDAVTFVTSPVSSVSSGVQTVTIVSTSSFNRMASLFEPIGLVLGIFFNSIPSSLKDIGTFILVCFGVLMVVRRTE